MSNLDYLEIGTSIFKTFAELFSENKDVKGLSIEIVPHLYEILKNKFQSENKLFLNYGLGKKDKFNKEFFYVDSKKMVSDFKEKTFPIGLNGIASFEKQYVIDNLKVLSRLKDVEKYILVGNIDMLTYKTLIKRHNIKSINFLKIDIEGFDKYVVNDLLESDVKPLAFRYEGKPFMTDEEIKELNCKVSNFYHIIELHRDYFCYLKNSEYKSPFDGKIYSNYEEYHSHFRSKEIYKKKNIYWDDILNC